MTYRSSPRRSTLTCWILIVASAWFAWPTEAGQEFGKLAIVGDSITQGGATPSYRYPLWKRFVDADLVHDRDYTFVGSQTGFYAGGKTAVTPDYRGQTFPNVHEGHWGWRAAWIAGASPVPKGRHDIKNLGAGTAATWTGLSPAFVTSHSGSVAYAGRVDVPDTLILLIGINDLADGVAAPTVAGHIQAIVRTYQTANPGVRVVVCSTLPVSTQHAKAALINPRVAELATLVQRSVRSWATKTSRVEFVDVRPGFDATRMTYDGTHPNEAGESVVAENLARGLGIGRN